MSINPCIRAYSDSHTSSFHQAHSFRCLIRLLLQAGCPSEAMIPSVILSECYKGTKMEIDNSLEFSLKLKVFLMPVLAEVSTSY